MDIFYSTLWSVLEIIKYLIIARAIISFLPISKENQFINVLYQVTEPLLAPIRSLLHRMGSGKNMMFDFSPVVLYVLIVLVQNFIE